VRDLSNVYTGDDFFVKRVLQELHAKVADVSKMRRILCRRGARRTDGASVQRSWNRRAGDRRHHSRS
jgi:hypothetical protein